MLHHVKKKLGGRFSLTLFVDDVDNEPPVLLESCNISLCFSSAGELGIKCSVWYERTGGKKEWRVFGTVVQPAQCTFLSFFDFLQIVRALIFSSPDFPWDHWS